MSGKRTGLFAIIDLLSKLALPNALNDKIFRTYNLTSVSKIPNRKDSFFANAQH